MRDRGGREQRGREGGREQGGEEGGKEEREEGTRGREGGGREGQGDKEGGMSLNTSDLCTLLCFI